MHRVLNQPYAAELRRCQARVAATIHGHASDDAVAAIAES
jgi:hypothetical protein